MATINDFGIPGVSSGGILQPKLKDSWRVTFANMGGGADSQPVSAQAITITRPSITYEEVQLDRYNSRAWVASKHTWEPITLTVEDDITGQAARVIRDQHQAQKFLVGAEGPFLARAPEGSNYKFVTYLDMLDGNDQVLEKWTVEGCWFQACDWTDLDYAVGEKVQIQMTIRFDHARQDLLNYTAGQGIATGGAGAQ